MSTCYHNEGWGGTRGALWPALVALLAFGACMALTACAGRSKIPPSAPPAVEVLVPVTKPCEVAKVDPSPLPSAQGVPNDIFDAVKTILADRAVLLGDREKLVAANTDPCPNLR